MALLACGPLTAQAQPSFPDPSGPFEVGRLEIDVTDAARDETFTAFPGGTVLSGNPAGGMSGAPPEEQDAKLARLGEVWVRDQRFVLDQLAAWNERHAQLRGRPMPSSSKSE